MLRAKTKREFFELLDQTYFTSSNYNLAFADNNMFSWGDVTYNLGIIKFLPDPEFQFKFGQYGQKFKTEESPGHSLLTPEKIFYDDLSEVMEALRNWTDRLYEEYKHGNPLLDEFEALKESLESKFQEHETDLNLHFSAEELISLRAKLEEFDKRLSTLTDQTAEMNQKLSAAHEEIEHLKANAANIPRGIWYRMASNKMVSIFKGVAKSKEGKEFALEAAKKFLLE